MSGWLERRSARRRAEERRAAEKAERMAARIAKATDGRPVRLDYDGEDIWLLPTPYAKVVAVRHRAVAKEPWTVAWLTGMLQPGDVFWDVGANVGAYSLIAAKACPQARVIAVEAAASSFDSLVRNVFENDVAGTVAPLCLALASHDGLVDFLYGSLEPGEGFNALSSRHLQRTKRPDDWANMSLAALAVTLDTLVETCGLPSPTHLKVDVEDGEVDVLRGARRTLAAAAPASAMVELDADTRPEVEALLAAAGLAHVVSFGKEAEGGAVDAFFARDAGRLGAALADVVATERGRVVAA